MHLAKIFDIKVLPDRQRKSLDDETLEDLMRGIADKCLLHPITCRKIRGRLVLVSGERRFYAISRLPNVRDKGHAAEKPTELYIQLLKHSCLPRDRVLDPCCGNGTIFQAARQTLTTATGIECDYKAYALALMKLQGSADALVAAE